MEKPFRIQSVSYSNSKRFSLFKASLPTLRGPILTSTIFSFIAFPSLSVCCVGIIRRKIQTEIADYLDDGSEKILIIDGARQIRKSFIIRHEGQKRFKNYIEIDLYEDKKGDRVFEGTRNKEDFHLRISTFAGNRTYPDLLTLLKFLRQDDRFTYVVSGSQLGIALNETLSKPGGKIKVVRLFQLEIVLNEKVAYLPIYFVMFFVPSTPPAEVIL